MTALAARLERLHHDILAWQEPDLGGEKVGLHEAMLVQGHARDQPLEIARRHLRGRQGLFKRNGHVLYWRQGFEHGGDMPTPTIFARRRERLTICLDTVMLCMTFMFIQSMA